MSQLARSIGRFAAEIDDENPAAATVLHTLAGALTMGQEGELAKVAFKFSVEQIELIDLAKKAHLN